MPETRRPLVELLYFDGCPNHASAQALVERVSTDVGLGVELRLLNILDPDAAVRERFLGSPSIRVDGRDVEPGAEARTDYALSCRVYRTETGQLEERWLRDALRSGRH